MRQLLLHSFTMGLLLWLMGLAGISAAADPEVKDLIRLVESRYRNVQTLRATFLERYVEGGTVRIESGTVYFRRAGKMRWEYESPEPKLFVSDGKTVWFYVPADRTVLRTPVKESADWRMPFALLTREAKLSRICSQIELLEKTAGRDAGATETASKDAGATDEEEAVAAGHAVLRCRPEENSQDIREIVIEIDAKSGDIGRVLVREAGGVEIDFRFANWKRDVPVAESQFHFKAPVGVAIVEGLGSGR